jgi:simple sugar transport system permease protein
VRALRGGNLVWPLVALAGLFVYNLAAGGSPDHIWLVTLQAAKVMLVALGMTFVIATGGIDLSVGSVMSIAGAVGGVLSAKSGLPLPVALLAALASGVVVGLLNGVLVGAAKVQPIIATLVFMVLGRGVAMLVTGGKPVRVDHPVFLWLGDWAPLLVLVLFGATLLAARRTALGLFISAVGDNEEASRLCGLPGSLVKVAVYGFSGFCAAVAGLVAAARVETADATRLGELVELDAIFAVVVGGTVLTGGRFSLAGSMVGALLIQMLSYTMIQQGMPPEITPVPKALVILALCLAQAPQFRAQVLALAGRRPRRVPAGEGVST